MNIWALVVLLAAGAGMAACDAPPPPRFPHLQHLAELDCGRPGQPRCLSCVSCHDTTTDRPPTATASICASCHDNAGALLGRPKSQALRVMGESPIAFPHGQHLALEQIAGQCVRCHTKVTERTPDSRAMPPMSTCLECHQKDFDTPRCTLCHRQSDLAEIPPQSFMRHDAGWMRSHGRHAARRQPVCQACHTETWCADCHDQRRGLAVEKREFDSITRQFVHRGDMIARHPLEVAQDPASCNRCHTAASCDACHLQRGVSAGRVNAVSPHPIGWMARDAMHREFHGRHARRNLISCMACHERGPVTNCIGCHRSGGPGGNPHPTGWASSRSPDATLCRYCHGG